MTLGVTLGDRGSPVPEGHPDPGGRPVRTSPPGCRRSPSGGVPSPGRPVAGKLARPGRLPPGRGPASGAAGVDRPAAAGPSPSSSPSGSGDLGRGRRGPAAGPRPRRSRSSSGAAACPPPATHSRALPDRPPTWMGTSRPWFWDRKLPRIVARAWALLAASRASTWTPALRKWLLPLAGGQAGAFVMRGILHESPPSGLSRIVTKSGSPAAATASARAASSSRAWLNAAAASSRLARNSGRPAAWRMPADDLRPVAAAVLPRARGPPGLVPADDHPRQLAQDLGPVLRRIARSGRGRRSREPPGRRRTRSGSAGPATPGRGWSWCRSS